jgi:hypothetical protein
MSRRTRASLPLRLVALERLGAVRRFPADCVFALEPRVVAVRRLAVVRCLAAVRRFNGAGFFRDERDAAVRFLRFATGCLLTENSTLSKKISSKRGGTFPTNRDIKVVSLVQPRTVHRRHRPLVVDDRRRGDLAPQSGRCSQTCPDKKISRWTIRLAALFGGTARGIVPNLRKQRDFTNEKAQRVLGWRPGRPKRRSLPAAEVSSNWRSWFLPRSPWRSPTKSALNRLVPTFSAGYGSRQRFSRCDSKSKAIFAVKPVIARRRRGDESALQDGASCPTDAVRITKTKSHAKSQNGRSILIKPFCTLREAQLRRRQPATLF